MEIFNIKNILIIYNNFIFSLIILNNNNIRMYLRTVHLAPAYIYFYVYVPTGKDIVSK